MEAAEHLSFGAYMWRLAFVIFLVLANAFFVAAEIALETLRLTTGRSTTAEEIDAAAALLADAAARSRRSGASAR